jgi:Transposase DDE domain
MNGMKKHISAPALLKKVRHQFKKIPDTVGSRSKIPLVDCLMSGLAVFGMKMPSLLQFDEHMEDELVRHNLKALYEVERAPCDTYLRERLDDVVSKSLRNPFKAIFSALQRQKILERYEYYKGHYLISLDATGCFSSHEIHCESCCVKNHKDGSKTYYHQMLGAVLVHPDEKTVIPLAPEPISKPDGDNKNDCELNAVKRQLESIRREHPHLKIIVTEDGLFSKAPHIKQLKELEMSYIIGAKPGDHKYLFEFIAPLKLEEKEEQSEDGTIHQYRFINDVPLNDSNFNCKVNFLEYKEISPKGKVQCFTWVTDILLDPSTVNLVMRGGRARWKIENETFNTLKNQGYHFEHNFGHGYKNLSTVMAMLMFLAFLIDQAQETCCAVFQKALKKAKKRIRLWNRARGIFMNYFVSSWDDLYGAIAGGTSCYGAKLRIDTS